MDQSPLRKQIKKQIMSNTEKQLLDGKLPDASEGLKIGSFGFVDNYNLKCGTDGVMRVKDGRTLNEYINNPSIVKARKDGETNHGDWILITATNYERGCIPHCA